LDQQHFVAPDNGVLSLVLQRSKEKKIISIESDHYFRKPVSPTFHGRDILAPVAGQVAKGIEIDKFGPEISDFVELKLGAPKRKGDLTLEGVVLHVDKFGNIITSISAEDVKELLGGKIGRLRFKIGERVIDRFVEYYAEGKSSDLFGLVGSSGYFEIAAWKKPAARLVSVKRGSPVEIEALP
jgi:S-adenosylmethionine hydrolase